jgi:hypothetical protein
MSTGMRDALNALQCKHWPAGSAWQWQFVNYERKFFIKAVTIEEAG